MEEREKERSETERVFWLVSSYSAEVAAGASAELLDAFVMLMVAGSDSSEELSETTDDLSSVGMLCGTVVPDTRLMR